MVTMKLSPVRIDEKPMMKTPNSTGNSVVGVVVLYGA